MRTFWAWRVVGDSRAGFSRLTSAAIPRAKDLRGRSKVNNYFINFAHSFLFKSTMAADMNYLFEQDPTFPFCGSAEDRASFYSAKFSRSDDKSSGGPIRKPRRSKVVLKMEYSKQCKKVLGSVSDSFEKKPTMRHSWHDDVPIFEKKPSMSDSDDDVPIFVKKPSALDPDDDEPIFSPADFTALALAQAVNIKPALAQAVNINVQAQIERIRHGARKVRLIEPLLKTNLATDVVMLVRACIDAQCVTSLELLVSPTRPCRRCTVNDLSFARGPLSAQSTHRP